MSDKLRVQLIINKYELSLYEFDKTYHVRRHAMELINSVNLIFILVVNILFFITGIFLNSLVIVSFWGSVQLRKKLCYFTIMILSSCDLLVVLNAHPVIALVTMLWLTEKMNLYPQWLVISYQLSKTFLGFSLFALMVMSVDQYLATHYPIFHRTSVTKGKLLTLFAFLVIILITVTTMSINDLVIPHEVGLLILFIIYIPPMVFINYKLFTIARKSHKNNGISPKEKKSFSLKNISSSLLVVACLSFMLTPVLVYIVFRRASKETQLAFDDASLTGLWAYTATAMNSTFNCLIFYWKNKTLRVEGMKVIKSMKICRRGQSSSQS